MRWLSCECGNEVKFVCVDGPEFDGHLVDFDNMIARLHAYSDIEKNKYKCFVEEGWKEKWSANDNAHVSKEYGRR